MKEYLLFVDTETSGLPKDWTKPYSAKGNWPHIVQLAWVIYTKEGEEVKSENHYIKTTDYRISQASRKIHGITDEFLEQNGKDRETVMRLLYEDLVKYKPMVVGHFMLLDFHMVSLGFYRTQLENPLKELPTFCTMRATQRFLLYPEQKFLRLDELYERLFQKNLPKHHDAMEDAYATAACFFEMWSKGDIDEESIAAQLEANENNVSDATVNWKSAGLLLGLILLFIILYLIIS